MTQHTLWVLNRQKFLESSGVVWWSSDFGLTGQETAKGRGAWADSLQCAFADRVSEHEVNLVLFHPYSSIISSFFASTSLPPGAYTCEGCHYILDVDGEFYIEEDEEEEWFSKGQTPARADRYYWSADKFEQVQVRLAQLVSELILHFIEPKPSQSEPPLPELPSSFITTSIKSLLEESESEHKSSEHNFPISPKHPTPEQPESIMSQDLANLMQRLIQSQTKLQTIVVHTVSNQQFKTVSKLFNYDGQHGDNTRRFLAAFNLYADLVLAFKTDYKKKITLAIFFLERDAAVWTIFYFELIHEFSATDTSNEFERTFKFRFEITNTTADVKDALQRLYQGRSMVETYTATFKQYGSHTGYSNQD